MERPEVRIISSQTEEITTPNIDSYEKNALLAKYGYKSQPQQLQAPINDTSKELTFEEVVKREEAQKEYENNKRLQQQQERMNMVRPYTFDDINVSYSSKGYASEDGIGIQINVVSDIPINKDLWQ